MSRIRILPMLIFLTASLLVLFGGWILYRDYGVVRPLQKELISTRQVNAVDVRLNGSPKVIEVSVNRVSDLQTAYKSIQAKISNKLNAGVNVKMKDKRTPELEKLFQNYQPIIYEGIAKGSFTEMIDKVQSQGRKDGLDRTVVTMDSEYLYIQLERGDNYLYEVIPYNLSNPATGTRGVKTL
ncbi:hypothetical protein [Effusibacillus lacus]|uniref:Uncharacterized protein n=1 Tax=Effusibacillus lacus TaxID=1348429 RepID=A0A292YLJ5_9BACL|nr:hypothetical protein [Effusibacillus lacus]TCS75345.1 hypothetical protein EDD64_10897 [Effusibacillus lacus]GAX89779.1 hypothetical protein EFBL_1404 [Effusibacillus lacus]